MVTPERFTRIAADSVDAASAGGAKFCSRRHVIEKLPAALRNKALENNPVGVDAGAFLGRLWARFGAPHREDEGFRYLVRDTGTQQTFEAYSGPSGPSYATGGGWYREGSAEAERTMAMLVDFETWLGWGEPVECAFEYEHGEAGLLRIGIKDGKPFSETLRPPSHRPLLERAQSVDECFRMLEQWEAGKPLHGFRVAFEDTIPEASVKRRYSDFDGFYVDDEKRAIIARFESSAGAIPVDELELPPLDGAAALWMAAYHRWRSGRPGES